MHIGRIFSYMNSGYKKPLEIFPGLMHTGPESLAFQLNISLASCGCALNTILNKGQEHQI